MCDEKPKRCIDSVVKFCQEVLSYCVIEGGCIYGFENDEPTAEELAEFEEKE